MVLTNNQPGLPIMAGNQQQDTNPMHEIAGQPQTIARPLTGPGKLANSRLLVKSFAIQGLSVGITLIVLTIYLTFYPSQPDQSLLKTLILIGGLITATLGAFLGGLFLLSFYHVARYQKPKSAIVAIAKQCWHIMSEPQRRTLGLPFLTTLIVFMYPFVEIKNSVPLIVPYAWNEPFHNLDVWMHFGKAPWEWLHPLFSQSPYLVFVLNLNYNFWFFTMWIVLVPFAFTTSNTVLRTRFFLAFFLIWAIGGSVLATWFSSAGPAFYSKLGLTPDPYAGLITYLNQVNEIVPVWAIDLQNEMWEQFKGHGINVGISTMPSMHNATALLFVIGGWHLSKKMAIPLALHCFLIYIGSIYLAWRYAVDAYLGWLVTIVAWLVAGPIARWWHNRPSVVEFTRQLETLNPMAKQMAK